MKKNLMEYLPQLTEIERRTLYDVLRQSRKYRGLLQSRLMFVDRKQALRILLYYTKNFPDLSWDKRHDFMSMQHLRNILGAKLSRHQQTMLRAYKERWYK